MCILKEKLFTIVITHYNQLKYYETAIDSVLSQKYSNIELIFADDATEGIEQKEIESYIEKNKRDNIVNYKVRVNKNNLGTVKNLNNAIDISNGEYILFFAADDRLFDDKVIEKYIKYFNCNSKDTLLISSQCVMYDNLLKKEKSRFINPAIALKANEYTSNEQNKMLLFRSCYAVGATAFKKECFTKHGKFDESYLLIEDWSYMLKITREGTKIKYIDFNGLKHREGGISESYFENSEVSKSAIYYKKDLLQIYEKEIIPYISCLNKIEKLKILDIYKIIFKQCKELSMPIRIKSLVKMYLKNPSLIVIKFINKFDLITNRLLKKLSLSLIGLFMLMISNNIFKELMENGNVSIYKLQPFYLISELLIFILPFIITALLVIFTITFILYIVIKIKMIISYFFNKSF